MKRLLIAAALCVAALSGCGAGAVNSTPTPPATGVVGTIDTVILSAERGFGVAELAFTVAADGVAIPVKAGLIRGPALATVERLNTEGRGLLVKGKATADLAEKARIAARLFDIRDALNALKGGK